MNENRTKRVLIKEIIDSVGICRIGQQEQGVTPKLSPEIGISGDQLTLNNSQ